MTDDIASIYIWQIEPHPSTLLQNHTHTNTKPSVYNRRSITIFKCGSLELTRTSPSSAIAQSDRLIIPITRSFLPCANRNNFNNSITINFTARAMHHAEFSFSVGRIYWTSDLCLSDSANSTQYIRRLDVHEFPPRKISVPIVLPTHDNRNRLSSIPSSTVTRASLFTDLDIVEVGVGGWLVVATEGDLQPRTKTKVEI